MDFLEEEKETSRRTNKIKLTSFLLVVRAKPESIQPEKQLAGVKRENKGNGQVAGTDSSARGLKY